MVSPADHVIASRQIHASDDCAVYRRLDEDLECGSGATEAQTTSACHGSRLRTEPQRSSGQHGNRREVRGRRSSSRRPSDRASGFKIEAVVNAGVQARNFRFGSGSLELLGLIGERLLERGAPGARYASMR